MFLFFRRYVTCNVETFLVFKKVVAASWESLLFLLFLWFGGQGFEVKINESGHICPYYYAFLPLLAVAFN